MEQILIDYLTNAIWQIPLLAIGAWLFIRIAKSGPRTQHCVWLAVLALAVGLPLRGVRPGLPPATQATCTDCSLDFSAIPGREVLPRAAILTQFITADSWLSKEFFTLPRATLRLSPAETDWLVGFYFAILLFGIYRILASWRRARQLVADADPTTLPPQWNAIFQESGRRLDARLPQLRTSDDVRSPVIVGVMHPVLLLPEDFDNHSQNEVQAALFHELAHVRRHDYLGNLLCQMVALPVAWHPLTYGVQQRIRRTREMICDDIAARAMQSEVIYAKCLLAMAGRSFAQPTLADASQVIGLFGDNVLEERIMRLMQPKNTMTPQAKLLRIASGASAMVLAIAMAALFHVTLTLAQTTRPAVTVPSPPAVNASTVPAPPPAPPLPPEAKSSRRTGKVMKHPQPNAKDESFVPDSNGMHAMTPAQKAQLDRQMAAMNAQIAEAARNLNSPEFKRQMADIAKQQADLKHLDFAQMQRQIDAATAKINSPRFKQQMADIQKQIESGAMQRSMDEARRQMKLAEQQQSAMQKLEMDKVQQQIDAATTKINSQEFKQGMQTMRQQIESGAMQRGLAEAAKRLKAAEEQLKAAEDQMRSQQTK